MDTLLDRRRERARGKAGARLVALDLSTSASMLKSIEDDGIWFAFQDLPMVAWPEYRDVLAVRLGNDQFELVSQAVTGLGFLSRGHEGMFGPGSSRCRRSAGLD